MAITRLSAGLAAILLATLIAGVAAQGQQPRLIRSLAGPAGTVKESEFVLDETRNRFVYPQDRTVTVYFEWEHLPGDHVLTATWRQPDGRVASISPDVKISTTSKDLKCYWTFTLAPGTPAGAWTVDIRINGQPAGAHAFELAGTDGASGRFTLDQVSKAYGGSVVRVHKADAAGRRVDSSSGFVLAANAIATSFQSMDSASTIEIEFPDGVRTPVTGVLAHSRQNDWAVLGVETGNRPPIPVSTAAIPIGSQLAGFSFDSGTRLLMPVAVGGIGTSAGYSARVRFAPALSADAVGGPLIDESGKAVGIVGGSLTPGARVGERALATNPWLWRLRPAATSATAIVGLPASIPSAVRPLADLTTSGVLTPLMEPMPELMDAGTTMAVPRDATSRLIQLQSEFSPREVKEVTVFSFWRKAGKLSRGELSATMSTVSNEVRARVTPKRISLSDRETRVVFAWPIAGVPAGYYRIDLLWDGKPVWRTYVRVTE
jgi:hypothetical protein